MKNKYSLFIKYTFLNLLLYMNLERNKILN